MAQYQELSLDKFTEGMIDEDQLSRIAYPEGSCVECENILFMPTGAIKKRNGYIAMNTSAFASGNTLIKIASFTTTGSPGSTYALAFACNTTADSAHIASVEITGVGNETASFNTIGVTPSSAASSWGPLVDDPVSMTTYGGSAVMTHWGNEDALVVWPGTTPTASAVLYEGMTPSGAKLVQAWSNFLFIGNVVNSADNIRRGSRIQWSQTESISAWPVSQWLELDPDDGDEITAMTLFKNKLIVFKNSKMFQIHFVGGGLMFQEERISPSIGCVGPNALMDDGGTLYFIGPYTAYKWNGAGVPESISDKIQSQWNNVNMDKSLIFDVDSDSDNWQVWFNVCYGAATTKNRIYAFDSRYNSWTRYSLSASCIGTVDFGFTEAYMHRPLSYDSYSDRIIDCTPAKQGALVFGGDGILYEYGKSDNDNGSAINGYWVGRWLDLQMPHSNKRLLRATAFVERTGDYDLHIDLYSNWNTTTPLAQKIVSLSGAIDYPMIERRMDFTAQFRSVQFKVYTDGLSEPFTLHRLLVDWVGKGKTYVSSLAG